MPFFRRVVFRDRLCAVQRQHHPEVSVHQRSAIFRRHHERFSRRLPFRAKSSTLSTPASGSGPEAFYAQPTGLFASRFRLRFDSPMGTKSREIIYGSSVRASAEQAAEARKQADRLACEAWNKRMLGFQGPAQPSPTLGDALNAGYLFLEVKCLGCITHQTVALNIVRRPKTTPIHELERYMRCKDCSQVRRYPYKRSHLVALRPTKISANDPPLTWWPGER
jgi:hypothetical protein